MRDGQGSDVQGVSTTLSSSSHSKTVHLAGLVQPTINEVAAMVAHFKGWLIPALVVALAETGFVHRTKWSNGESRVTQEELDRVNRCLSRHIDGQILMNRNFIWFAKVTVSEPIN
ncbi:MAG: hypothetical protein WAV25_00065 [Minisyncoccia bacterium]